MVLGLWKTRGCLCMPTLRGRAALMDSIVRLTGGTLGALAEIVFQKGRRVEEADMVGGGGGGRRRRR